MRVYVLAALSIAACTDGPLHPVAVPERPTIHRATVAPAKSAVITVQAKDLPRPYVYNVPWSGDAIVATLPMPAGAGRTITARASGDDATPLYQGSTTIDLKAGDQVGLGFTATSFAKGAPVAVKLTITGMSAVGSITIATKSSTVAPGTTAALAARVFDGKGNPISNASVLWATTNPAQAAVDAGGVLTAILPGRVDASAIAVAGGMMAASPPIGMQLSGAGSGSGGGHGAGAMYDEAIVYVHDPDGLGQQLFEIYPNASHIVNLTQRPGSHYAVPAPSAVSGVNRMAFVVGSLDQTALDFVDNDDFAHPTELMPRTFGLITNTDLSPDNARTVLFGANPGTAPNFGPGNVFDISVAGGATGRQITNFVTVSATRAAYFPTDNTQMVLTHIWVVNTQITSASTVDGSLKTQLTNQPIDADFARMSPDGNHIVYVWNTGPTRTIWVMNADGTGQRRLSDPTADAWAPSWSLDGAMIAFIQLGRLYVMNANGTQQAQMTAFRGGDDFSPRWRYR